MTERTPVYQKIRILLHEGVRGVEVWIIETRPQVNAALRELFKSLDADGCYRDIGPNIVDLLPAARAGEHSAIYRILKDRQNREYEGWRVSYATDATAVVSSN